MAEYLSSPIEIGNLKIANRVVFQPMEGCDCNEDGSPHALTVEKYRRAARSGAGIVWFEANAVCPEGRTNVRQMMLTTENIEAFRSLVVEMRRIALEECGIRQVLILQLTHSGRQSIQPMIAYKNAVYEEKRPIPDSCVVEDAYLDRLPQRFVTSARLAMEAGFDGVDVKSCHGYLIQELLSAFTREGRYGGCFENRSRLYLDCVRAVKEAIPHALLTTRLSVSDMVAYPNGFGTDANGDLELSEADLLIDALCRAGIQILNVTVGNPYHNPHVNRPYRQGGYLPPEPASVGLERFEIIEKHIKERFSSLLVVGSGLSYYREDLIAQSERLLSEGICDFVGYGRMSLAYPEFYREYLNGCFSAKKCCLACSKCTVLMRNKCVSGCAVFHPYYRELYRTLKI